MGWFLLLIARLGIIRLRSRDPNHSCQGSADDAQEMSGAGSSVEVNVVGPDHLVTGLRRFLEVYGTVHVESGVDVGAMLTGKGEVMVILGNDPVELHDRLVANSGSSVLVIASTPISGWAGHAMVGAHGFARERVSEGSFPLSLVDDWGMDDVMAAAFDSLPTDEGNIVVLVDLAVLDSIFEPDSHRSQPGGLDPRRLARACFLAGRHPRVSRIGLLTSGPNAQTANLAHAALSFCAGVAGRQDRPS